LGLRNSFVWRRAGSTRLLLSSVLLSTLIAASMGAALVGFAASTLPQAVSGLLARSGRTTVAIYGAFGAPQVRSDAPGIRTALRRAFGAVPFALHDALWSDPLGLPVSGGTKTKTVPLIDAAAPAQIMANATLVAGSWPAPPMPGQPIPAAVPVTVADALHLAPGGQLSLRDRVTGARVRIRLTGLYRPLNPLSPYWGLDLIASSGVSVQGGFTTYGPLVVARPAFGLDGLAVGGATWLAVPQTALIGAGDLSSLASRLGAELAFLSQSPNLNGLQVTSGLPATLKSIATNLVVAKSLLAVGALELALLAAAALTLTARTLAGQREEESAMLSARGAGRWQLARLAIVEALLVTAVAAGAGALAGSKLAGLLARSGPLRSVGLRAPGIPADVWWAVGVVLLLCLLVLLWPAVHPVMPAAARVRKGRQAAMSAAARAGGDVSLVLLALLAGWQLRRFSEVGRTANGIGIDPVLALAPAFALAAAAVLPLRLLPALARIADRLAGRTRRLGTAMVSWEISRRTVRQSAPMLLVVLAVGTGTLALAQHQSWHQSALDQSAYTAGADVRVDTLEPASLGTAAAIGQASGVTAATPVSTALSASNGGQVLALNARTAAATVLLRTDDSAIPAAALWRRIIPAGSAPTVALPGRPARLEILASMDPGHGALLGPVLVSVSIEDAAGVVYSVPAGSLPVDGRSHGLVADLSARHQALYPLRLLSIWVSYTMPPVPPRRLAASAARRHAAFTVRALAVSAAASGAFPGPFASGQLLARWAAAVSAASLGSSFATGSSPALAPGGAGPAGARTVTFQPGNGFLTQAGPPLPPPLDLLQGQLTLTAEAPFDFTAIPGIATRAFLSANQLAVGDLLQVSTGAATLTVHIVAAMNYFPTVTDPGGGLIVDQTAVQQTLAAQSATALPVMQWWLTTTGGSAPAGLPAGSVVTDRARIAAGLLADPLAAIPQQAVQSLAVAAALIAILGFSVSIAGRVRERRSQSALLAAFGVGGTAQASQLCLEALTMTGPAAATGLLLGVLLARLLVPAVTLTAAAAGPVPPVLVEIPWPAVFGLALAIAAIPVLVAAAIAAYRPDPAGQLRTAEAT